MTGDSVQRVIDAVGLAATRQQALKLVEKGGRIAWIGLHSDETPVSAHTVINKEAEIVGSFCYTDANFRHAIERLEQKYIVPDRTWLDIRPLEDGPAAFAEQIDGPAPYPKIVLAPRKELFSNGG